MLQRSEPIISGVRKVVLQSGPADSDEALVFIHGNPGFSRDWEDLMTRAGAFCRCVAPDMPGFGHSDKPESFDYTVDGYARHLGALLTQLNVRRAHLVLHDFGGPWGLAWALSAPSAVASLTLVNCGLLSLASLRAALAHADPRRCPDGDDDPRWLPCAHPARQSARTAKGVRRLHV
jgi:pimeloyl-ACP methyl ester carboxylesterase